MEEFTPNQQYHPEEEYEALEAEQIKPEAENAQAQSTAVPERSEPQQDVVESHPVEAAPAEPVQQTAAIPQPPLQTPPVPPVQPTAYPNNTAPHGYSPYYQQATYQQGTYQQTAQQPMHQPMQHPVQQPMQQPIQQTPYYYPNTGYQQAPPNMPQAAPYPQQPIESIQPYAPVPKQGMNYAQAQPANMNPPKPPTPTGTKVFIIVLCALLAAMIVGFGAYIASTQSRKSNSQNSPYSFSLPGGSDGGSEYGFDPYSFNQNGGSFTDVEDTVTLIADNGETQKRDDDNPDSVGEPNEDAKNIRLEDLPKDKDDRKYTTQTAYDTVLESVVTVVCYKDKIADNSANIVAQGSGAIISSDGYLITNAHVIGNSRVYAVNIVLNNGDKYQAKIVGYDSWTDLAVLKIDAKDLKAVTFGDSEKIKIGDDVIAVGSPGGEKFQNTLTKGVISAVDRELAVNKNVRYIQSDAAISPGSSGGPLCNIYGQVIGITTAKAVAENFESMSFSIPSATVEQIVGDLMHYGYVKGRTRIGFSGKEIAAGEVAGAPAGVVVSKIDENGSLAGTKLKEGDIITELDGKTITSFQDIYDVLDDHKPDDKITVKAKRASN